MAGGEGVSRGGRECKGEQYSAKAGGRGGLAGGCDALAKGVQVTIGCGEC
jgi:hypothetical protein